MKNNIKRFDVFGIVAGYNVHAVGRCGAQPIRPGDTFLTVVKYRERQKIDDFELPPECEEAWNARLKVVEIRAYEQRLCELGPGMTGSLVLEGEGAENIEAGRVLEVPASA